MDKKVFPKDFLFGTATAALQIEGGDKNNNWYDWSEKGMIDDGSHSVTGCDHWNRIDEDVDLSKDINSQTYRMGLEWSRVMPTRDTIDKEAIAKYRHEIELLLENGIKPLVTIWHFSHPMWVENNGGWTNSQTVNDYLGLVKILMEHLGDIVTDWITLNEPNVYLLGGYFEGHWPPGKKGDIKSYLNAASYFIDAHIKAYKYIHDYRKSLGKSDTVVGVAHHLRIFEPLKDNWLTRKSIFLIKRIFQDIFVEGTTKGNILFPLKGKQTVGNYVDFIGINYYSRDIIKGVFKPGQLFGDRQLKADCEVNDLNWEIYPEGIYKICKEIYDKYQLPIYITENGTCDANDKFRKQFIKDHLSELHRAIGDGIDIQRYYHWTLMDNFEWTEGNSARFGLYHNDFETQKRTLRESGEYYKQICAKKEVF